MANALYEAACLYIDSGWSVHPLRGKVPVVSGWESLRASKADAWSWWEEDGHDGIGIICGAVSGNLLVIDIEGRLAVDAERMAIVLRQAKKLGVLDQMAALIQGAATTPSGGRHLFLTVVDDVAPGNEKLAYKQAGDGKDVLLVETRGEGGQVAAPPGRGRSWLTEPWTAYVTAEEAQALLDCFRVLDESVRVATPPRPAKVQTGFAQPSAAATSVAEALAESMLAGELDWVHVLDPGWTLVGYDRAGRSLLLRPEYGGEKATSSASAHGYERFAEGPSPVLVVHSSAVSHLPQGTGMRLTPGRVLSYCHFSGDDAATYRSLEEMVTLGVIDPRLPLLPEPVLARLARVCEEKSRELPVAPATATLPEVEDDGEVPAVPDQATLPDTLLGAFDRLVAGEEIKLRARIEARRRVDTGDWVAPEPAMGLQELLDLDIPPLQWRVDGLLVEDGTAVLIGQRKAGKTSVLMHLARCLADGDPFLGEHPVERPDGRIYLLDYEMSQRQGRAWLESLGVRVKGKVATQFLRKKRNPMLTEAGREWLVNDLRVNDIQVLIADPLAVMFAGLMESENDNAGLRRALALLEQVAGESGVREILLAAHAGKTVEQGARGASAIEDWPDALWRLFTSDDEDDASRYFSAMGRDVDVPESQLAWDPTGRGLRVAEVGMSRKKAREGAGVQGLAQAVVDALHLAPGLTLGALKNAAGNRSEATLLAVQELVASGLVYVDTSRRAERYSLTAQGESAATAPSKGITYTPPVIALPTAVDE